MLSRLQRGVRELGLELDNRQQAQLFEYLELLHKWNASYNLTAVRDPGQMLTRHLLDSLAVAPYLQADRALDVGTGAGLPGVPLAILFPDRRFDLLDSNGKKTRFLFQVKTALGLANMQVHQARVECFLPADPYAAVLSRAFSSLAEMVAGCGHLLAPAGRILAMKGTYPAAELAALAPGTVVAAVHRLRVPGLDEQRHLVELTLHNNGEAR